VDTEVVEELIEFGRGFEMAICREFSVSDRRDDNSPRLVGAPKGRFAGVCVVVLLQDR